MKVSVDAQRLWEVCEEIEAILKMERQAADLNLEDAQRDEGDKLFLSETTARVQKRITLLEAKRVKIKVIKAVAYVGIKIGSHEVELDDEECLLIADQL